MPAEWVAVKRGVRNLMDDSTDNTITTSAPAARPVTTAEAAASFDMLSLVGVNFEGVDFFATRPANTLPQPACSLPEDLDGVLPAFTHTHAMSLAPHL